MYAFTDNIYQNYSGTTEADGTVNYQYDQSNRLTSVDGQSYTWDAAAGTFSIGLTQVLQENGNTYLYGNGRIAQVAETQAGYFLPDAPRSAPVGGSGSVRQVADGEGALLLARSYDPYGNVVSESGKGQSLYGYTGEQQENGLVYLRARYYAPVVGRFMARDAWNGEANLPMSYNKWLYGYANPQRYTDPTGFVSYDESKEAESIVKKLSTMYGVIVTEDWGMSQIPVPAPGQQIECAWKNGRWSLWDLKLLDYSVEQLSDHMRGNQKFRQFIGPVTVVKTPDTCGRGCTYNFFINQKIALIDEGKPAKEAPFSSMIMTQTVDFDAWSVVHELGHAWDYHFHNQLSAGLEEQTGGYTDPLNELSSDCDLHEPGCNKAGYFYGGIPPKGADSGFNKFEDFAESVAAYVFPVYAQNRVRSEYYNTMYRDILYYNDYSATERYRYIDRLINDSK